MLRAVTAAPDWLYVADHPWTTFCPASGNVKVRVQPVTGSPRFLMPTLAVNPPGQLLVV
jgi:hypothetical protein